MTRRSLTVPSAEAVAETVDSSMTAIMRRARVLNSLFFIRFFLSCLNLGDAFLQDVNVFIFEEKESCFSSAVNMIAYLDSLFNRQYLQKHN